MNRSKLQKYIFNLLIILLPTQLGRHFWPAWAYVSGVRVDYFSPTLYLTDILILFLFALTITNYHYSITKKKFKLGILAFLIFVIANVCFSLSPFESAYKWLKVAEFGFLAWFMARNFQFSNFKFQILLIPIFYESILAVWQFIKQSSVGGWWYWLGERTFNSSTAGIANAVINGQLVLRPYGTLPHPNVLVGFLVVSGILILTQFTHISRKITAGVLALAFLVLLLTPSRGDIWRGLALRQQLNNIAVTQWVKSPIIGTGLGTSPLYPRNITNFALLHQPIHNIYFLVLSETGIIGLGLFILLLISAVRHSLSVLRYPIYAVLFLGLFDHYFLTLQQGQLILALIIGLALGRMNNVKKLTLKGGEKK